MSSYIIKWQTATGDEYVADLNGVPWYQADPPLRKHRCWAQTRGQLDGELVERCVCGAFGPAPFILLGHDKPRVAGDPDPRSLIARGLEVLRTGRRR